MKTERKILDRIVLARHTIGIYERNGLPDLDRPLIASEIDVMRGIIQEQPSKAATLQALVKRAEALLGH